MVEDGSGAVGDRGNPSPRGGKGRKVKGHNKGHKKGHDNVERSEVIAADNIHAVVITNIAARIRKGQYRAAAEALEEAARMWAGIKDKDINKSRTSIWGKVQTLEKSNLSFSIPNALKYLKMYLRICKSNQIYDYYL